MKCLADPWPFSNFIFCKSVNFNEFICLIIKFSPLQLSLSSIPDNLMNQKGMADNIQSDDNGGGVDAVIRRETFSRANSMKNATGCVKSDDGLSVGSSATIGGTKTATILVSKTKTKTGLPLLLKNSIN